MITHVYVLHAHVVLMVAREHDGSLVIRKEGEGIWERAKDFREEALEPEPLLHPVHGHDVLALRGGEGDNLLALGQPGDGATVNEKRVARYGSPVLGHGAIGVRIAFEDTPRLAVRQAEVVRASQVVEDPLDGLPMRGPGVCPKCATVATADMISGRVASTAQLSTPMASRYGTSRIAANSEGVEGACSEVRQTWVSMGVESSLTSTKLKRRRIESM